MSFVSRRSAFLLLAPALALSAAMGRPASAQAPAAASAQAANKTKLGFLVKEDNPQLIWRRKLVSGIGFNLSAPVWKVMLSPEGVTAVARLTNNVAEYAREARIGDLDKAESTSGATRAQNQPAVDALLKKVKAKIGIAIEATSPSVSPAQGALLVRYINRVGQILADEEFTPKSGSVQIKLVFSPSAEDIDVTASNDAATSLTILLPTSEPDGWDDKIRNGLRRVGKE